ncbi:MAG: hypothetical protein IJS38_01180 [Erysipelotrichaceae bacterium]|nr:hypothetical protein [Erysipelotrichaceae bacterium]
MEKIRLNMVTRNGVRNLLIYAIIFSALFSSLFLSGISSEYEQYISDKTDLFLYLQADIYGRNSYEDVRKFNELNDVLDKNSFECSDISQNEYAVYKTAADESFMTVLYWRFEKVVSNALSGSPNDEELDELFKILCYDYRTGEIHGYINGNGIELHNDDRFIELYPYIKLAEGRSFTKEEMDAGESVCLIDDRMVQIIKTESGYTAKNVEPGDTVYFTKTVFNDDFSATESFCFGLKVVGLLETKSVNGRGVNQVFVPEKTMERILKEHGLTEVYKDRIPTDINECLLNIYKLSSFSQLRKLKKQIDKYKSDSWTYYTSLDKLGYSGMADIVFSISKSFKIISYVLIILIILVSAAMIILDINARRNEIGLLKSMGKEDKDIIRENTVTRIVTYMISAVIGYFGAVKLSRTVMEYQFSKGGSDGSKLLNIADKLLRLNTTEVIIAAVFIIILCIESAVLYRYLIGRVTVKELLEKQE